MPFPKDAMVEVNNDVTPWYGQVEAYVGGVYTIRIGGTDMRVDVAENFVKLHPAMQKAEELRMQRIALKIGSLQAGTQSLKMIEVFGDILGMASDNKLANAIIDNPSGGTILTLCNVNALLTLMWPCSSHVIVVDNDSAKISNLNTLIGLAEKSETLLDWHCLVYATFGKKILDQFVARYRPHYQNFLALKQCRPRVHIIDQDLALENTIQLMTSACHCDCIHKITSMYVSNIEYYVHPTNVLNKRKDVDCLGFYRRNILGLMQENAVLIRGDSVFMEINRGKAAVKEVWKIT